MRILFAISVVCFAVLVWIAFTVTRGLQSSRFGGKSLHPDFIAAPAALSRKRRNRAVNEIQSRLHHSRTRKDTR